MQLLQQKQKQLEEAFDRISKMQEEIQSLSKQLAQSQRCQYDVELQLIAKSQKLHERDLEIDQL
jgi:DNA-binding protein H-NS